MADRDLKLNSLGRYGKNSENLILEEHSHCEVPAGCGGVVLRWRSADSGLNFLIRTFVRGKATLFLDGAPLATARPLVPFGRHVFALAMEELLPLPGQAVFGFAAIHDDNELRLPNTSRPSGRKIEILSAADGSWHYTTTTPAAESAWMLPGFDDAAWATMIALPPPTLEKNSMLSFRLRDVERAGAGFLSIRENSARAWVRREFLVDPPGGAK